jgi:2-succinyl-5-enolpyruvyl-6-hydroxy-3-cyclohexene-1-carboxylate synthase
MTVQATFAATVTDELVRAGVTDAVVSPGSRSTPLALALAGDGRLRVHVVLDERSAGFFGLGIGLATGRPAVVVTTSGTAAVEVHPAVVEASHARVPLLVCTADRPPELHHVGAPQTVEQARLFDGVVRWSFDPGVPDVAAAGHWRSMASRAVAEARANGAGPGPVHLNLPFRDPLVGEPDGVVPGRPAGRPWHEALTSAAPPPPEAVARLAEGGRGVVVAGAGAGDPAAVHAFAAALGWPLLADSRSGCRYGDVVAAADAVLRVARFAEAHRPDVVVRLGAPWASKVVADWMAGVPTVLVDPDRAWLDPSRSAAQVVRADPTLLCRAVADAGPSAAPPEWAAAWRAAEAVAQAAFDEVLAGHPEPTEPGVARALAAGLPDGATLVVSSSMPVRDVEWYAAPREGLRVLANRGANGIDGVTSTAFGVATQAVHTTALVGDLAFLHDVNALLIPRGSAEGVDCTVVVVDNDGGGIFSFLPQRATVGEARFERLFGTPQGVDLAALAAVHGIPVSTDLASAWDEPCRGVRLVRVRTDRQANVAVHDELHAAVASRLEYPGAGFRSAGTPEEARGGRRRPGGPEA